MDVCIVDPDVSYPATSGKRLRTLNLMLQLARRHRITYIARCNSPGPEADRAVTFLRDHGIAANLVAEPIARKSGLGFYGALARNMTSPLPYVIASHITPRMRAEVQRHAAQSRVDLWQLEWLAYDYCVDGSPAPVVLQAHNIESLIWQRYVETASNPLARLYLRAQWQRLLRFERAAFAKATRIVAVSRDDAELAHDLYGTATLDVVDNGVDVARFESLAADPGARTILFLGALDWRPNLDAADQLLSTVFPAVRALVPDARLHIVGRSPPDALRTRAADTPGVTLFADVPDVQPFLAGSTVMAVPLRIGGGSRLKILESLAAGLPVVSTRVGAEGLELTPGEHFVEVETPQDMAPMLARALTEPAQAIAQAEAARQRVAARYDWSLLAGRLEASWERAVASRRSSAGAHTPVRAHTT